jgi:glycosyltransferase involved in cell wall biosynthesis
MFSILIPVYNYPVSDLVHKLLQMGRKLELPFEIILGDDGSPDAAQTGIEGLDKIPEITIYRMNQNTGRSAIRNFLGSKSNFEYLLFLDDDGWPESEDFLLNYVPIAPQHDVICGGRSYSLEKPSDKSKYLHWLYGSKREVQAAGERNLKPYEGFQTNNFWIRKSIFIATGFDTRIKSYGHEDTLFGYALQKKGVHLHHIDNPMRHMGLVGNLEFLEKTKLALQNLAFLQNSGSNIETKLSKTFKSITEKKLLTLSRISLKAIISVLEQNLLSKNPILTALDTYKLYHYMDYVRKMQQ